jgi:hypothetical protein
MKPIVTILLVILSNAVYSQKSRPSVSKVYQLFKASINQPSKKSISIGSGDWIICNQDSAFF